MNILFAILNKSDGAIEYLDHCCHEIMQRMQNKGVAHSCIANVGLTKDNIKNEIERHIITPAHENIFIYYGHGGESGYTLLGVDGNTIVDAVNANILAGWNIYCVACSAGLYLGPLLNSVGAKSFIGYKGKLMLPRNVQQLPGFKESVNAGLIYFINHGKGNYNHESVYTAISNEYSIWIDYHSEGYTADMSNIADGKMELIDVSVEEGERNIWYVPMLIQNQMQLCKYP